MLSQSLLFILINLVIITVQISASRVVLFLLVGVLLLMTYKAISGYDQIDKFAFEALTFKIYRLRQTDLLSILLSILLKSQSKLVHFTFIAINLLFILIVQLMPPLTLFLVLFNLVFILEFAQHQVEQQRTKTRNRLNIKTTDSIFVNQNEYSEKLEVPFNKVKYSRSKRI